MEYQYITRRILKAVVIFLFFTFIFLPQKSYAELYVMGLDVPQYVHPSQERIPYQVKIPPFTTQLLQWIMDTYGYYLKFYYSDHVGNGAEALWGESAFNTVTLRQVQGSFPVPGDMQEGVEYEGTIALFSPGGHGIAWTDMFPIARLNIVNGPSSTGSATYLGTMYAARNRNEDHREQLYSGIFGLTRQQGAALVNRSQKLVAQKEGTNYFVPVQVEPWTYYADGSMKTVEVTLEDTYKRSETHIWRIHMVPASQANDPVFRVPQNIQNYLDTGELVIEAQGHVSPLYDHSARIWLNSPVSIEQNGPYQQIRVYNTQLSPVDSNNPLGGPMIRVEVKIFSNEMSSVGVGIQVVNSILASSNGNTVPAYDDFYFKRLKIKADNATIFAHDYTMPNETISTRRIGQPYKVGITGQIDLVQPYTGAHWMKRGNFYKWDLIYLSPDATPQYRDRARRMAASLPTLVWVNDENPKNANSPYSLPTLDNTIGIPNMMSTHTLAERENLARTMWSQLRTSPAYGIWQIYANYFKWTCCGMGGGETGGPGINSILPQDVIMRNSLGISADAFVQGLETLLTVFDANESRQGVDTAVDKISGDMNSLDNMARHFGDGNLYTRDQFMYFGGRVHLAALTLNSPYPFFRRNPAKSVSAPYTPVESFYRDYENSALPLIVYKDVFYTTNPLTGAGYNAGLAQFIDHNDEHFFRYSRFAVPSVGYGNRFSKRMVASVSKIKEIQSYAYAPNTNWWSGNGTFYRFQLNRAQTNPTRGYGDGRRQEDRKIMALVWSFDRELNRQSKEEVLALIPGIHSYSQLASSRRMGWSGATHQSDARDYCVPSATTNCANMLTLSDVADRLAARRGVSSDRIRVGPGYSNVLVVWQNYLAVQLLLNIRRTLNGSLDPQVQSHLTALDGVFNNFATLAHVPGRTLQLGDNKPVYLTIESFMLCPDSSGNGCTQVLTNELEMYDVANFNGYYNYTNQVVPVLALYYPHLRSALQPLNLNLLGVRNNAIHAENGPGYWAQQASQDNLLLGQ